MLNLGVEFPNYEVKTNLGTIKLHDFLKDSWALICSDPADFSPGCATDIARIAQLVKQTEARNIKLCFVSCDPANSHTAWLKDIEASIGCKVSFLIINDENNTISKTLGMYEEGLDKFQPVRGVFVLDPNKKVKMASTYPVVVGHYFDGIVRFVDTLIANIKMATTTN